MSACVLGDLKVFAALLGALIAGVIGILIALFQEWRKNATLRKVAESEDIKKIYAISDYLKNLRNSISPAEESSTPVHVIFPFVNQVEFAQYQNAKLNKIREFYNSVSYDIHVMENFLVIQGNLTNIGDIGRQLIQDTHKRLRKELLGKIISLQQKIESFTKDSELKS